ncbi:MAG TPA: hypothetical protein VIK78_04990 [Ruminiclostridium sp.]
MIKKVSLLLSFVLVFTIFAGCGSEKVNQTDKTPTSAQSSSSVTSSSGPEAITLPIVSKPITLKVFWTMDPKASAVNKTYNDMAFFKEMEIRTGIHIEFQHPPVEQAATQLNLMLASNDLADMIFYMWSNVPGGVAKLISDGMVVKLNDYIDKYAPNIKKTLSDNPEWKKQAELDDGTFYKFPKIKDSTTLLQTSGFQVRQDWLDKLSLKAPVTIDDWYNVLKAFRDRDPNGNGEADEIPFTLDNSVFTLQQFGPSWKVQNDFIQIDGKVGYGPMEPGYKDFVTTMAKWYKEKLIDPDYLATDSKSFESKVVSNKVGTFWGMSNGHLAKFTSLWKTGTNADNKNNKLVGIPPPIASDGKKYSKEYQPDVSEDGLVITSANKYIKESVKWADYIYGPEGKLLSNYGIEGQSYTMVDGKPKLTDDVLKNSQGLSIINALHKYTYAISTGPCVQMLDIFNQTSTFPEQNIAFDQWTKDVTKINLTSLNPTEDEGKDLAKNMGDIKTYVDEMFNKFVMGLEPLDKYDEFVKEIKNMGIDDAIKIKQDMLDRYNNKK